MAPQGGRRPGTPSKARRDGYSVGASLEYMFTPNWSQETAFLKATRYASRSMLLRTSQGFTAISRHAAFTLPTEPHHVFLRRPFESAAFRTSAVMATQRPRFHAENEQRCSYRGPYSRWALCFAKAESLRCGLLRVTKPFTTTVASSTQVRAIYYEKNLHLCRLSDRQTKFNIFTVVTGPDAYDAKHETKPLKASFF